MAVSKALRLHKGVTFEKRFVWKTTVGGVATPVDLTGYTAKAQIRSTVDSTAVLFEMTTENGGIALGADGGIDLLITDEETAGFDWVEGVYDLLLYAADGKTYLFIKQSDIEVVPGVTR